LGAGRNKRSQVRVGKKITKSCLKQSVSGVPILQNKGATNLGGTIKKGGRTSSKEKISSEGGGVAKITVASSAAPGSERSGRRYMAEEGH